MNNHRLPFLFLFLILVHVIDASGDKKTPKEHHEKHQVKTHVEKTSSNWKSKGSPSRLAPSEPDDHGHHDHHDHDHHAPIPSPPHKSDGVKNKPPLDAVTFEPQKFNSRPKQQTGIAAPYPGVFHLIFCVAMVVLVVLPILFFVFTPFGFASNQGQFIHKRSLQYIAPLLSNTINLQAIAKKLDSAIDKYLSL